MNDDAILQRIRDMGIVPQSDLMRTVAFWAEKYPRGGAFVVSGYTEEKDPTEVVFVCEEKSCKNGFYAIIQERYTHAYLDCLEGAGWEAIYCPEHKHLATYSIEQMRGLE